MTLVYSRLVLLCRRSGYSCSSLSVLGEVGCACVAFSVGVLIVRILAQDVVRTDISVMALIPSHDYSDKGKNFQFKEKVTRILTKS